MSSAVLKMTAVSVTSKYGWRVLKLTGYRNLHKGCDTANGTKYPTSAFGDGRVKFAGRQKAGHPDYERGLHVIIEHAPGIETSAHSLSKLNVKTGDIVKMGDIIGWAGKTAIGASGDHVHHGLWLNGKHVDPLKHLTPGIAVTVTLGGSTAGNGATLIPNVEEDDMFTEEDRKLLKAAHSKASNAHAGIFYGGSAEIDGVVQTFKYGVLPIAAHNQTLIARQAGTIAALSAAVSALSGGSPINLTAIEEAAEKGAREALDGLTFKAEVK